MSKYIPIEISARHVHLSKRDLIKLFGEGYALKELRKLSQMGEFAAQETVDIIGSKGKINNVRIIGPIRENSQVEISKTDGYMLGIIPPIRVSGDIKRTPGIKIIGPNREVNLLKGLIIAKRHIHMSEQDAKNYKVKNKQNVSIKITGDRSLVFNNVAIRVKPSFRLSFQIDTDEANAGNIENGDRGELII